MLVTNPQTICYNVILGIDLGKGGATVAAKKGISAMAASPLLIKWVAVACATLLLLGTLPLYAIAFYNHPYYDDYNFSADTHSVWQSTHSPAAVLAAALESAQAVRARWQGTYTGTFLSNLQPGVFSESLYWLTTFLLLSATLLGVGFLLWTLLRHVLHAGVAQAVIATSLTLFVSIQFLPAVNEAFFWFNGGVGNIFIYALLAFALALMLRLRKARGGAAWLTLCLLALTVLLGGGSYGGGLLAILLYALAAALALRGRNRYRLVYMALALVLIACFAYNMSAPGNALRARAIGRGLSPLVAVARALYYGVALMGEYFSLPVAALALGLALVLYPLARDSAYRFRHPALVGLLGMLLFCAQLTPPLYAGVFLGGPRAYNTYYVSFLLLLMVCETYALGALARRLARDGQPAPGITPYAARFAAIAAACLFAVGCLGYKPDGETLYGPMHMAGGSAALSLVNGEARTYHREMLAREALLRDASQPTVTLAPLSRVPAVFMPDLLAPGALDDVRPALAHYYGKQAVLPEGGDAQ